jgi:hypothetical protein
MNESAPAASVEVMDDPGEATTDPKAARQHELTISKRISSILPGFGWG